jgi:hypothetical protein
MARVLVLALAVLLLPSSSFAPTQRISALAPFEVVGDGFDELRGIAVDANGVVFVADHHAGTVTRIARDHPPRIIAKRLKRPIGLAFDAAGHLLVAEEKAGRVVRLDATGTTGTRIPIVSGVKQPRWLAVSEAAPSSSPPAGSPATPTPKLRRTTTTRTPRSSWP